LHFKRFAVSKDNLEGHTRSSDMAVFDRPYITSH